MADLTTVDIHAHIIVLDSITKMQSDHPEWAPVFTVDEAGGELGHAHVEYSRGDGRYRSPAPLGLYDVDRRLADMDRAGVGVQVVSAPPYMFNHQLPAEVATVFARHQNDAFLEVAAARPDRLHVLATLPMQDPQAAVAEIKRIGDEPLVRGVEVGSNVDQRNFDDPMFEPIWDALEQAGLPVLVHPDAVAGADRLGKYHLVNLIGNPLDSTITIASLIFGGVVERHPDLRFGFVHGGGFAPYQIGRWDHGFGCRTEAKVAIDTPPSTHFASLFIDSLTHDQLSLEFLGRRMGWDHVLLGSDYPFDMAEADPVGRIAALGLPEAEAAAVLGRNAERFLRRIPQ